MRVEQLSTYGADQIGKARRTTQTTRSEVDRAEIEFLESQARLTAARRSRPLFRRLFGLPSADERAAQAAHEQATRELHRAGAKRASAEARTRQREVGEWGEEQLTTGLSHWLSDEWLLFRSYLSKRGEADGVLVGPRGLWVVEVKTRRVALHINGDDWHYDQLDRGGRPVRRARAVDAGGRTWGRQASDAAQALHWWLTRNDHHVPLRTAVVLMAPQARIASCVRPGVDLVAVGLDDLALRARSGPLSIEPSQQRDIERLVRRDHDHTLAQRARRTSGRQHPS